MYLSKYHTFSNCFLPQLRLRYQNNNPSARFYQLAFGQLPIKLCFVDVIKPRKIITARTEWSRVVRLAPDADISNVDLSAWSPVSFITESYKQWWQEWKEQLFSTSVHTYRHMIDPDHAVPDDAVSSF
jgi:hypothetical protein